MNETGPFDRPRDTGTRDPQARMILIGMGVLGLILLVLVLSPFSLLGGGGDDALPAANGTPGAAGAATTNTSGGKAPKVPEGFEALSRVYTQAKPKDPGPYTLTLMLLQPITDTRNVGLYTSQTGKWERLMGVNLVNNGTAVIGTGTVTEIPKNLAVLRLTANAVSVSGWLPAGAQADASAVELLSAVNPRGFRPAADGSLQGVQEPVPQMRGSILPSVRAAEQADVDAVSALLSTPASRQAHIDALVQLALQQGNAGIDLDYQNLPAARKGDFTSLITALAEALHKSNRTLSLTLPAPVKAGVSWDTGAYDWEELSKQADQVKLLPVSDPSTYYKGMDEVYGYLKGKLDLKKVSLVVTRFSRSKGSDGLRAVTLQDGLTLASTIELRTTAQITPNTSVVLVGKNIFQDDGASGIQWDATALAVSFTYPDRGGTRSVWLENSFSLAFRLDQARRYGLGGIAIDDISQNPALPSFWDPLREYAGSGSVTLVQPNGVLLRPIWAVQAGSSDAGAKGNLVWKAPAQSGSYDVSLVVSDGIVRALQKVVLDVRSQGVAGAGATVTPTGTVRPGVTPTVRP